MQHNLTFSALALIPFSLAAASNPSPICSIIVIGEGSGTAARGAGGGGTHDWTGNLLTPTVYKTLYFKGRALQKYKRLALAFNL